MLVDTHAHVQVEQFHEDRFAVINAALTHGVDRMVVPGVDVQTSADAVTLAGEYRGQVYAAVGVHPHDATSWDDDAHQRVEAMAVMPGVVAIGEIGLDYYRDLSPRAAQHAALISQLAIARQHRLPVVLHSRDAHSDLTAILREHGAGVTGVFHCFIGDQAMARDALDLGFYLSFAGPLTYPRNQELRDVAAWAPIDRVLIETDSPYLAPQPVRGKRNEPRYVVEVARRLAQLRDVPEDQIAADTTRNAVALFGLQAPALEKGA